MININLEKYLKNNSNRFELIVKAAKISKNFSNDTDNKNNKTKITILSLKELCK